jgi:heat-inducible transcriptional repressor
LIRIRRREVVSCLEPVPTARGYRLFVDTMLTAQTSRLPLGAGEARIEAQLHADQPQRVIANAAQLLSSLSSFVGVITAPKKASVFHHIEFMRLSERRVLVILVAPDGDVQNRVIFTAQDYTSAQLQEASNVLNAGEQHLPVQRQRCDLRCRTRQANPGKLSSGLPQ